MDDKLILNEIIDIKDAIQFAAKVHKYQKRKSTGKDYITHPLNIYYDTKKYKMSNVEQILAILHDTYEDSKDKKKIENKIKGKFGTNIWNAIKLLSHDKDINYSNYLINLFNKSKLVFSVKLLDMKDNLSDIPTEKQKEKYKQALNQLKEKGIIDKFNIIQKHILNDIYKLLK